MERKFYTVNETAELLRMDLRTVQRHIKSGAIKTVKVVGKRLILAEPLDALSKTKEENHEDKQNRNHRPRQGRR